MKLGAQFLAEDFAECMDAVVAAERAGFAHAWFVDSQILWQDCYVYMTRALESTTSIVVGTAVSNPFTRHPTVTASVNATLAELHPGRVILGLGRGDSAVRTMGMNPVPTKQLRAAVPDDSRPDGRERRRRSTTPTSTSDGAKTGPSSSDRTCQRPAPRTSAQPAGSPTS